MLRLFFQLKMMESLQFIATMYDELMASVGTSTANITSTPPIRQEIEAKISSVKAGILANDDIDLLPNLKSTLQQSAPASRIPIPKSDLEVIGGRAAHKLEQIKLGVAAKDITTELSSEEKEKLSKTVVSPKEAPKPIAPAPLQPSSNTSTPPSANTAPSSSANTAPSSSANTAPVLTNFQRIDTTNLKSIVNLAPIEKSAIMTLKSLLVEMQVYQEPGQFSLSFFENSNPTVAPELINRYYYDQSTSKNWLVNPDEYMIHDSGFSSMSVSDNVPVDFKAYNADGSQRDEGSLYLVSVDDYEPYSNTWIARNTTKDVPVNMIKDSKDRIGIDDYTIAKDLPSLYSPLMPKTVVSADPNLIMAYPEGRIDTHLVPNDGPHDNASTKQIDINDFDHRIQVVFRRFDDNSAKVALYAVVSSEYEDLQPNGKGKNTIEPPSSWSGQILNEFYYSPTFKKWYVDPQKYHRNEIAYKEGAMDDASPVSIRTYEGYGNESWNYQVTYEPTVGYKITDKKNGSSGSYNIRDHSIPFYFKSTDGSLVCTPLNNPFADPNAPAVEQENSFKIVYDYNREVEKYGQIQPSPFSYDVFEDKALEDGWPKLFATKNRYERLVHESGTNPEAHFPTGTAPNYILERSPGVSDSSFHQDVVQAFNKEIGYYDPRTINSGNPEGLDSWVGRENLDDLKARGPFDMEPGYSLKFEYYDENGDTLISFPAIPKDYIVQKETTRIRDPFSDHVEFTDKTNGQIPEGIIINGRYTTHLITQNVQVLNQLYPQMKGSRIVVEKDAKNPLVPELNPPIQYTIPVEKQSLVRVKGIQPHDGGSIDLSELIVLSRNHADFSLGVTFSSYSGGAQTTLGTFYYFDDEWWVDPNLYKSYQFTGNAMKIINTSKDLWGKVTNHNFLTITSNSGYPDYTIQGGETGDYKQPHIANSNFIFGPAEYFEDRKIPIDRGLTSALELPLNQTPILTQMTHGELDSALSNAGYNTWDNARKATYPSNDLNAAQKLPKSFTVSCTEIPGISNAIRIQFLDESTSPKWTTLVEYVIGDLGPENEQIIKCEPIATRKTYRIEDMSFYDIKFVGLGVEDRMNLSVPNPIEFNKELILSDPRTSAPREHAMFKRTIRTNEIGERVTGNLISQGDFSFVVKGRIYHLDITQQ